MRPSATFCIQLTPSPVATAISGISRLYRCRLARTRANKDRGLAMTATVAINCSPFKQYFASRNGYHLCGMETKTRGAVASNIKRLRKLHGWSQVELFKRSGVAQRTISNLEWLDHPEKEDYSPTLENLEKIAIAFGVEAWQLMLPNVPETLLDSKRLGKMVQSFLEVDEATRADLTRNAEEAFVHRPRGGTTKRRRAG